MAISKLVMPTKTITIPHPQYKDFVLDLKFISREVSRRIQKEAQKMRADNANVELDDQAFNLVYAKEAFAGWKGLTYNILSNFVLLDESQIDDMNAEIPFTVEDAAFLITASQAFESWVNKVVFEIDNFRTKVQK